MIVLNPKAILDRFFKTLGETKESLLILDYDGTLSPFSLNPSQAFPYPGVCERIEQVMKLRKTEVVIISGRDLESLTRLLPLNPLPELWGSHGGECLRFGKESSLVYTLKPEIKHILTQAAKRAKELVPDFFCEVKPLSIALHWRGHGSEVISKQKVRIRECWKKEIGNLPLEIHDFDGGMELRVAGINKGNAVKKLLKRFSRETLIAYLGDDVTDEDAFQALGDRALKILVRKELRTTLADLCLVPPQELLTFFDQWIDVQQKGA
jgi:trehalose 6-phosphate phosphatase